MSTDDDDKKTEGKDVKRPEDREPWAKASSGDADNIVEDNDEDD